MKWQHRYDRPRQTPAEDEADVQALKAALRADDFGDEPPSGTPVPEGPQGAVAWLSPRTPKG